MFPMKFLPFSLPPRTSSKIKSHFHNLVSFHVKPLISKAKSTLIKILRKKQSSPTTHLLLILSLTKKKKKKTKSRKISSEKSTFGSFRFHHNWCSSSHVMPVTYHVMTEAQSNRNSVDDSELADYFDGADKNGTVNSGACFNLNDEIDRKAEMFIAKNHERFRLEKQSSYNKYKEMLARSC